MSLSLLEVDLDEKALVAGKQTNNTANTTQESVCLFEAQLSMLQGYIFIYSAKSFLQTPIEYLLLYADEYLSLHFCQHVLGKGVERG